MNEPAATRSRRTEPVAGGEPEDGRIPTLVLGSGLTLLGVSRILGDARIPFQIGPSSEDLVGRSDPGTPSRRQNGTGVSERLADYLRAQELDRAVVIPCADDLAIAVAGLPEDLGARFPSYQPTVATLRRVIDKWELSRAVADAGVPGPRTHLVEDPKEVSSLPWLEGRALFVKPRDSLAFFRHFGVKALLASDPRHLQELVAVARGRGFRVVVQEYVPGPASNHYFVDGFAGDGGRIVCCLVRRRLRMYPRDFGNSTYMVTAPAEEARGALESLERLLPALDYRGIFSAEFKRDEDDGVFRILEVNVRPWWYVEFAARAGVDVVSMVYDAARGLEPSPPSGYEVGRRLIYPYYDIPACFRDYGRLGGLWRFVRDMFGTEHPVFAWRDPLPALKEWLRLGRGFLRRRMMRPKSGVDAR